MTRDHKAVTRVRGWLAFDTLELIPAHASEPPEGPRLSGVIEGGTFLPPYGSVSNGRSERPQGVTLIGGYLHLTIRRFHPASAADAPPFPRVAGFRINETGGFWPEGPVETAPAPAEGAAPVEAGPES